MNNKDWIKALKFFVYVSAGATLIGSVTLLSEGTADIYTLWEVVERFATIYLINRFVK